MPDETVAQPSLEIPIPPVPPAPEPAVYIPKRKFPFGPILLGFFLVIFLSGVGGVLYFKSKFTPSSSPVPSPSATAMTSLEPSIEPSATPSAIPSAKPKTSPKPTPKPVSASTVVSPTPTLIALPTLDLRFGNPSVNIKQTYDDGSGAGRVINREYTSIQAGQFDEVQSAWSPRVTVCYHIVSNEDVPGKNIKFSFTLDDQAALQDNLGQYDKLEAGRSYDWCHDVTTDIGKHSARLTINSDKSLKEIIYSNDLARVDWENLADKIAPNFTLTGPFDYGTNGTCLLTVYVSDNVTPVANLKVEQKVDSSDWSLENGGQYCFKGNTGDSHTYAVRITDARGNSSQQSQTFVLY